jgi:hypothetical protein
MSYDGGGEYNKNWVNVNDNKVKPCIVSVLKYEEVTYV